VLIALQKFLDYLNFQKRFDMAVHQRAKILVGIKKEIEKRIDSAAAHEHHEHGEINLADSIITIDFVLTTLNNHEGDPLLTAEIELLIYQATGLQTEQQRLRQLLLRLVKRKVIARPSRGRYVRIPVDEIKL